MYGDGTVLGFDAMHAMHGLCDVCQSGVPASSCDHEPGESDASEAVPDVHRPILTARPASRLYIFCDKVPHGQGEAFSQQF